MQLASPPWARLILRLLISSVALSTPLWAAAGTGLATLPGREGDEPVTIFYPTQNTDQAVEWGPFTLQLAPGAAPQPGNGRLVVFSHGSGGAPWVHTDIARRLTAAGFVVAMPLHRGDNYKDTSTPGPQSWRRRPSEVSRAIDAVSMSPVFSAILQLDKVGVVGQSAGGHTALSLAGGVWSPARFLSHCLKHLDEDFNACVGTYTRLTGGWLDPIKKASARGVLRQRFDDPEPVQAHDPRIAVAVAGVPASADFDLESLRNPRIPVGLVTAGRDIWLTPRWHGEAVAAACASCERLAHLPEAGHSIMLSPPPPLHLLDDTSRHLLADPEGFDRSVLQAMDQHIIDFLSRHLLPLAGAQR
ncbi:alpha/beta hydrolase [Acidovorax sp. DW039]|uniref:alpha/beta hydrolase family protein n=1 Tax=Acidovorax sp. DW039 TaxID=3095606 RepID=UPI0030858BC7|nr:alpha/beta hydrolase [Acidovorax sp. DW039]